tara:strand:+ start:1576 stop:1827 length:252 start_codon:yes stop_codon:yes gene_type:complete
VNYLIKLHPKVDKFLRKLDEKIANRIKQKLRRLRYKPFRYLEHFESVNCYKLRIGDYRALVDISGNKILIRVLNHRKNIYKKR